MPNSAGSSRTYALELIFFKILKGLALRGCNFLFALGGRRLGRILTMTMSPYANSTKRRRASACCLYVITSGDVSSNLIMHVLHMTDKIFCFSAWSRFYGQRD
eukprot:TRINITY_DN16147_c1_g1_i2.p1 TRINITY_DN16147_c1_g1~~TRINITY_DN16147_c1_g1_i2.p1  ORF type:complete len:103 (+),score=3.91 TRINITY_DN16147_c1_g1_i2:178-486(+)